jgi:hypothetical protein
MAHALLLALSLAAQAGPSKMPPSTNPPRMVMPAPSPVEKLGEDRYRIGEMQLDTKRKELSVPGTVNDVTILEFVANTLGGFKSYESALTLNTNAVSFNAALLVLGLDPARGKPSAMQFDPKAPEGDPVELSVSWTDGRRNRTVAIEELLYDQRTRKTMKQGHWVYTGSSFVKGDDGPIYLAEMDGVLIGFMHGPQAIIDNPRDDARDGFGAVVLNPDLGLKPDMPVTVTVKVLPRKK